MTKHISTFILFFAISFISFANGDEGYDVGSKAIDFKLKNVDGKMISLADYDDAKGFIVIFTCNHCPYAQLYEDRIIALDKKYASKGYPVIAINPNDPKKAPDDSFDQMIVRAKDKGFTFPYLYDDTQEVAKAYGATRTPHVYILDKASDELEVKYIGAIDNNYKTPSEVTEKYVEDAVDALIEGKKVPNDYTKAIGCTIKWSEA
ncbi:MAG: thioredoxin family protein [Bacteroidota bacterium]